MSSRGGQHRQRDPRTGKLYRIIISSPQKLSPPPKALRRAKLDNLAIVPASVLAYKAQWQEIANGLPEGEVLIVLPRGETPQRDTLERTAALLRAHGHAATILSAERFG